MSSEQIQAVSVTLKSIIFSPLNNYLFRIVTMCLHHTWILLLLFWKEKEVCLHLFIPSSYLYCYCLNVSLMRTIYLIFETRWKQNSFVSIILRLILQQTSEAKAKGLNEMAYFQMYEGNYLLDLLLCAPKIIFFKSHIYKLLRWNNGFWVNPRV